MADEIPDIKPSEFDPAELSLIKEIAADPAGVPLHHTTIDAEQRFEDVLTTAKGLESNRAWFFLGLVYYSVAGIDRSLFEVYAAAAGITLDVMTVTTEKPVCLYSDEFSANPWSHRVQGVRRSKAHEIVDFLASFQLKRSAIGDEPESTYRIDFQQVRMADPTLDAERRAMDIWVARPVNLTKNRQVVLSKEPGFLLRTPEFRLAPLIELPRV